MSDIQPIPADPATKLATLLIAKGIISEDEVAKVLGIPTENVANETKVQEAAATKGQ